jgi:hypothetical protein
VSLGGTVEVCQRCSTSDERASSYWIDPHAPHPAQIDLKTVLDDAAAAGAVRPATHGDFQTLPPRETDRGDDIAGFRAANDDRRTLIDRAVPDDAGLVVSGIFRDENLSADSRAQALDIWAHDLCHLNALPTPSSLSAASMAHPSRQSRPRLTEQIIALYVLLS